MGALPCSSGRRFKSVVIARGGEILDHAGVMTLLMPAALATRRRPNLPSYVLLRSPLLGAALAVWIGPWALPACSLSASKARAESEEAQQAMVLMRSAAYRWHVLHGESSCPSVRQLVEGRFLAPTARRLDPWGQPFVITCGETGAVVTSFGPDRRRATPDDIVVATANSELGYGR
jgi:hypothetical protein